MEFQRFIAQDMKIQEIDPEVNRRVWVLGIVTNKEDSSIFVDDGTGTVQVFADREDLKNIKEKQRIRIIGKITPTADSFEISAEAVHDMANIDAELFEKVRKLWVGSSKEK